LVSLATPDERGRRGWSILLVEDDDVLRALFAEVLDQAGFVVMGVRLAEEALQTLPAQSPDLIVLDLGMPTGTLQGVELLARLREVDRWRNLPVLVLSGYGDVVNPDVMARLRAAAVLTKPLADLQSLPLVIRSILG
jgi:CheY-like chemotaxis protein